jgi:hypothetical protein
MNAELEEPEALTGELLTEEHWQALVDPEALKQQLVLIKTRFSALVPVNELSAKRCAALASTCTFASKHAEAQRTTITAPLNQQVTETNAIWQPIVKGFEELARVQKTAVSKWVDEERRKAQVAQQKLIDEAKAKQDALDRKVQEERAEVERLRLEAAQCKTIAEAEVLHQEADRMEKKAAVHEVKASQVVTEVAPMQAKTLDLGSSSFSAKAPKNTYILPGWDKAKPLRLTDPKLATIVGDWSKLPEGVQFLLKHSDLNPVHLNKAFGVIEFPEPFAVVPDYSGGSVRTKG